MTKRIHVREIDAAGYVGDGSRTLADDGTWKAGGGSGGTAADVSYGGSAGLSATNVEAALDELDAEKVAQGVDQFRTGPRDFPASDYVKLQSSEADVDGMVIWTQKVGADSTDLNIDGSVIVKHGKGYLGTPGYADTMQVYTLAGSIGTILGNNNFVELGAPPYSIPGSWTPNGFIRFELGPAWPDSEVARLNNQGDLIVGWTVKKSGSNYNQSGTTVTRQSGTVAFAADDVGSYLLWVGAGDGGYCDRITGFISATQVTVETSRTHAAQAACEIRTPKIVLRYDGTVETDAGFVVKQRPGQAGPLLEVRDDAGTPVFSVDETGVTTPAIGGGGASATRWEVVLAGTPPEPVTNADGTDWLYVEV